MHRSCSCHQMLQTFWAESLYNSLLVNVLLQNIPCHFWKILNVLFATFCNMWWWPSSVYQFYVKQIWNLRENRRNKSYVLNYDLLTRHHSEIKPVLHWFSSNMFRFKPAWKVELGRLMFSSLKGHSSQSPSKRLNAIGNGCVRFNILSHTHMIWSTSFIPSILPSDWSSVAKKSQPAVGWNGVIHVLAHGFPGATLHPAKAKEHNSMRFTKFRQESGPQESGQDAVMVSFSGAVMAPWNW